MNVSKIIGCDLKNGIIKNKRFLIVPILCFFECMYNDNFLRVVSIGRAFGKYNVLDLFVLIFRGCDPISKLPKDNSIIELPYFWIAIFVFALFIGFEYMHDDLTQFGTQVITRCNKRRIWWNSKCLWCITSSLWFYILTLATIIVYAALHGYQFTAENNYRITNTFAEASLTYEVTFNWGISLFNRICLVIAPFMVICALNMLNMLLCLFIKPMYSYLIVFAMIITGTFTDSFIAFTRCGMLLYNRDYFKEGYNTYTGIIVCLVIIISVIIFGGAYFKKANILPDKE